MYVHPCAKCQYIPLRRPLIASVGLSMSAARPTLVAFFISSISSIRLLYLQCQSTCRWPWDCALTFLAVFYLFRFSSTWRTCLTTLSTLDLFGDATGEEVISAEYAARVLKGGAHLFRSQAAASRGYHGTLLCLCLCQLDARGNIPKEGKTLLTFVYWVYYVHLSFICSCVDAGLDCYTVESMDCDCNGYLQ